MRKILILGAVLLVLAGALFVAASNLNRYLAENREWLAEQASSALGRSVAFDEIGVSFRGGFGARVTSIAIGEDPAFGKGEFLRADRIDAVIKILPALRGRYEVARVEIDAPEIEVIKTRSGYNFDSLGRAAGEQTPAAEPDTPAGALPFLVSSLRIGDGRLRFIDRSASPASELSVDHLDFSASDVGLDHPIQLDLAAAVLGVAEQNVRVEGTLGPLGSPEAVANAPVDLHVNLGPIVVDRLKKLALIGEAIPPELSSPDPIALGVKLSGSLDALGTIVSMDASDAAISYGDQFAKPKGVRFAADADVKRVGDAIDVAKFDLHLAKAHLTGSGRIDLTPEMPVDFKLSGRDVPLDGWGRLIPATAAVEATGALDLELTARGPAGGGRIPRLDGTLGLRRVSVDQGGGDARIDDLTTTVTLKGDRAEIPPTDFKLNGSPVRIAATVKNLDNLNTDFEITSPELDVAALGAAGEGVKRREVLENVEVRGNFRSASSGPQLDATLRSTGGSLRDIAYRTLDGQASLRNQKLTFERLKLSAFDGSITGAGSYDMANPDAPAFALRGKVDGIDVGALFAHFGAGRALQMSGRLQGTFDLDGRGSEWEVIRQALVGKGALEVADGVLKGVNIAESVLGGLTGIPGLSNLISPKVRSKYSELFGMDDTVFEVLAGKMTLGDGRALLDEIALAAHDYRLDGKGTIGLDKALDIGMTFVASQNLTDDLIRSAKEIRYLTDANGRFNLPLRLAGSMPTIRAQPDVQYVARQLSSSLVQTGISKGLEALVGKKRAPDPAPEGDAEPVANTPAEQSPAQPDLAEQPAEQPPEQPDPAEELIRRGLGALLGGDQE
jgi:AsmA protein